MHESRSTTPQGNESERLEVLRRYQILDTPPDGAFDRVTALVAELLDVPISIVSLVDTDRIWFKSAFGLDATEVGRAPGLCASAILQDVPYVVEDASTDPRTLANPLVAGELGLRFYAGVPLRTQSGHNLGVLTAIDVEPRELRERDLRILSDLAQVVMDQMELRLAARRVAELHDELTQAHEVLKETASRDALTGLPNRAAILDRLDETRARSLREDRPMAVMIMDVDHFKRVNDECGHLAGDQVLHEVAARIVGAVGDRCAVGRLSGDEFLAVLYPCDGRRAREIADGVRDDVRAAPVPCVRRDIDCAVTLSVGVYCTIARPEQSVRDLLHETDRALYAAKQQGRDRTATDGSGCHGEARGPTSLRT